MTSSVKSPRLAAVSIAAVLAMTACGGSDAAPADDGAGSTAVDAGQTDDATDALSADAAGLQTSLALEISGEPLAALEDPANDPAAGVTAPVITGQQFDGADITIGGPTDGPTMLVFLAHWCPHCNDEIPEIVQLRDDGSLPANLNIIGISTAIAADRDNYPPSEWIVNKDWTWPVLADTEPADAFKAYGGTGFPYTVMLDADGVVVARKSGNESADRILAWIQSSITA